MRPDRSFIIVLVLSLCYYFMFLPPLFILLVALIESRSFVDSLTTAHTQRTSAPLPGGWAGNGVTRRARPEGRQECLSRYPHPDGNSPGSVK